MENLTPAVLTEGNWGGNPGRLADEPRAAWGSWGGAWSRGDWLAIGLAVVCLFLILAAPWLTEHTFATVWATLAKELRPFPAG